MNPTEVVSGPTRYEEDVLLLEYDKGDITLYDLTAGGKENDEQALEGMMREFREETGLSMLDVENMTALRPYTYEMDESTFRVHPFDIELKNRKDPQRLDEKEHDGYQWKGPGGLQRAGESGWLNSSKFFNVKYVEAAMNGMEELRGQSQGPELVFRDEEVQRYLEDLEGLIEEKLNSQTV